MDEEDNNERNKTENWTATANDNNKAIIGSSGFAMTSPGDTYEGRIDSTIGGGLLIDSWLSSNTVNEDGNNNITPGIHRHRLNTNNIEILIEEEEAEDDCMGCGVSQRK